MQAKTHGARWIVVGLLVAGAAACGDNKPNPGISGAQTVCAGTPTACGLLSASQCGSATGCAPGACSGTAAACAGISSSTECLLQQGCASSGSGAGACAGVALSCLAFSSDAECRAQRGCSWQVGCAGRAAACESLTTTACRAQPGCHLAASADSDGGTAVDTAVPTPGNCADAGVPTQLVIDDMEDQTPGILGSTAYGTWYVYADETVGGHLMPDPGKPFTMEPIPGGRCASEYAMRLSGTGFSQWGAGMGFDFGYGSAGIGGRVSKIPADARAYSGLRFWARVGEASTTRVGFSLAAGSCATPDGGGEGAADARVASDCALSFPKSLVLTTDWVRYDIPFDELLSAPDRLPVARDQIYSVGFIINANTTFDLWIDDISWIPAQPAP